MSKHLDEVVEAAEAAGAAEGLEAVEAVVKEVGVTPPGHQKKME